MKPPSTLNGHRGVVPRPRGAQFLNYEGELAVVIGTPMKGVCIDDALSHVGGYLVANDVGLHDFRHADRGAMLRVKGQDGFLPLSPEIVPAGDFDPTDFTLTTTVNGEVVQHTTAEGPHLGGCLSARRPVPADHAAGRRRRAHRHPRQLSADAARRRRRGRDPRGRPRREHGRRLGR